MDKVRMCLGENIVIGGVLYPAGSIMYLPVDAVESEIIGKAFDAAPMNKMVDGNAVEKKRGPGRPAKAA